MPPNGEGGAAYPPDLPKPEAVYRNPLSPEVNAHVRRLYAADIRATDREIERLVTVVRERMGPDWLIVFTADHGESLGEHDFHYDHGDYVYGASLQVPLGITLPPGHAAARGRVVHDWVSLVDVMPTLLELMEIAPPVEVPHLVEGRSLVPYLEGRPMAPRPVFAESGRSFFPQLVRRRVRFDVTGRFRAVVAGDWKLIWTPGLREDSAYELYDLASDPAEERNLYRPDHPEAVHLRRLLEAWLRPVEKTQAAPGAADRERLRALGYIE
jgi:arylsulfatase A-like enzyme